MIDFDIAGPRLRIRRAHPSDAEASFRWFADPRVTLYLPLAGKGCLPRERVQAFLEAASRSDHPELACTVLLQDGRRIGCGGFREREGGSAEVSLVLGEPDVWGQGYGREAMGMLIGFAFGTLGLDSLWLIVRRDNARGVGLFTSLGFRIVEGEGREAVVDGVTVYKHKMRLRKSDWEIGSKG